VKNVLDWLVLAGAGLFFDAGREYASAGHERILFVREK